MATVINRTTLELRFSAHTPDFPTGSWIINPNLTALLGIVLQKYWKIVGDTVVEQTAGEKTTTDADILAAENTRVRAGAVTAEDTKAIDYVLIRALSLVVKDEVNVLRALHGLGDRTNAQIKTGIKNKINSGDADS